ncbi:MAG: sulfide/dihydroorotate dehydrogenase-like FAD/NAD-binding protein [candidate division KSB1 bacterium]|nr:sulfide/dihydroorotate dehydrogenase-like FAD/NAD-binding protein [candidate division KSB1 bacterium]MDZ7303516.1 sulfide/dihydroorotate dehydrogenase-like FAD/NAD-binding protein [candidate division KSB1 bacterium]MDZ7312682.1 sulfide/dihydroorotate dehydrogenase-like FAD/NAD-binding protein [candidate division KSB1 bacterium]
MFNILSKQTLAPGIKCFEVVAPEIARRRKAGQFVILRVHEEGERIPITIADANPAKGSITLIVQEVGLTTRMMGQKEAGDFLPDVCGPLGHPTHIENFGHCVCLAGGVGVAEIYPVVQALKAAGNHVTAIIGARSKELLILEEQMRHAAQQLIVTTDDGSYGVHGLVTKPLQEMMARGEKIDRVFCIGPVPMMRAVAELTRPLAIPTFVSLNPIMVDGTGMCGGCRVTIGGKVKFACVDGPDFDAHQVDFDELVRRQQMYRNEEKEALERFVKKMESGEIEKKRCQMVEVG